MSGATVFKVSERKKKYAYKLFGAANSSIILTLDGIPSFRLTSINDWRRGGSYTVTSLSFLFFSFRFNRKCGVYFTLKTILLKFVTEGI